MDIIDPPRPCFPTPLQARYTYVTTNHSPAIKYQRTEIRSSQQWPLTPTMWEGVAFVTSFYLSLSASFLLSIGTDKTMLVRVSP